MTPRKGAQLLKALANPRTAVMLPLGFASGLPLALVSDTLRMWLNETGVALASIGIFGLVGLPYTIKFLWAPVMDRFVAPWLGRRRGWMLVTQVGLLVGIVTVALAGATHLLWLLGVLALVVAFLSASQDIAFDAYRTDVLEAEERGFGAALSVTAYRLAMLASGGFALFLADHIGFERTYLVMAGLMTLGIAGTLLAPEPAEAPPPPRSLRQAVEGPMREFFSRHAAVWLLVLILLYKIGDAFAGFFTGIFLRDLGFTLTEIGVVYKAMVLAATLAGALLGGILMVRLGLFVSLLLFGALQAVTNLVFVVLAVVGKSYALMVVSVALENIAGGMGTAAFVALLMSLCDHRYTATQYALLSALAAVGRVFVGYPAGLLADAVGWGLFFSATFVAALPGLWLLWYLRASVVEAPLPAQARS